MGHSSAILRPTAVLLCGCWLLLLLTPSATACTRVLYTSTNNSVVLTGRSMDWESDCFSNLWAMPAGMKRSGAAGPRSLNWTSKYGSVVVSFYDLGTVDGVNTQGLAANTLYLVESDYGSVGTKPALSIAAWAQYVLDSFATVKQAVDVLRTEPFRIVAPKLPASAGSAAGVAAQGHLSISDASGDSAIFEYLGGKLVIHHGPQYKVMTNSPSYDQQLALDAYWRSIGTSFLPGTSRAADRFARASFTLAAVPKAVDKAVITAVPEQSFNFQAIASVLGVVRGVSVPLGMSDPTQPDLASTLWRTVVDHKRRVLLFDSATSPTAFWVNVDDLNLQPGAPVRKLTVVGRTYSGNVARQFVDAQPFKFLPGIPAPSNGTR